MSHRPERKEKDCLNCGTTVQGRYCQVCGQENLEPKETFWGMLMHFVEDITHFDGKFFTTLKDLLFKPGFLSAEYMRGRRASYLNPIRMYVFTSALFFLVFFSMNKREDVVKFNDNKPMTVAQRDSAIKQLKQEFGKDTVTKRFFKKLDKLMENTASADDSSTLFNTVGTGYSSVKEYDSVQNALPSAEKDGWLKRIWNRKNASLNEKYRNKGFRKSTNDIADVFLHNMPFMLFVSLPLFALILKLLYRRRKEFYYADHGIFTIHHYIFSFILLLIAFIIDKLIKETGWGIWDFLMVITIIAWPVYLFVAMRRFYKQSRTKTFFKFILLNILGLISLVFIFLIFGVFSFFQL